MATAEALETTEAADSFDLAALVLNALAGRRRVVVPVEHLGTSLGLGPEALEGALRSLQGLGLVYLWQEGPGGRSACLTPLAAERTGLKLVAGQWRPKSAREPAAPQRKRTRTISEADLPQRREADSSLPYALEEMSDRRAIDPASVVDVMDARPIKDGYRTDYIANKPTNPTLLLGLRLQWPVAPAEVCPGCGGRRLPVYGYCLLCDRSGAFERVGRIKQV
jgi:hypothetical protein